MTHKQWVSSILVVFHIDFNKELFSFDGLIVSILCYHKL
uniref:Uncharacterized protein n=1 Tax=Rhizophora mucronata TaxID=61149 RepID=A0A2P2KSA3_RHIMU